MAPIKVVMSFGIVLMVLQTIATFFRDLARATGLSLNDEPHERESVI
jgi:TRAP-type mannitol/chloroaromatic compound transport system permease small subunit